MIVLTAQQDIIALLLEKQWLSSKVSDRQAMDCAQSAMFALAVRLFPTLQAQQDINALLDTTAQQEQEVRSNVQLEITKILLVKDHANLALQVITAIKME